MGATRIFSKGASRKFAFELTVFVDHARLLKAEEYISLKILSIFGINI
jgi:hypothetical protein